MPSDIEWKTEHVPAKKPKGRKESVVLSGVLAYLSLRADCWCWRQGVSAGIARSGQFMRSGLRGTPDILCVKDGKMYGLEVKREIGGKVSKDQETWGAKLTAAGGIYAIVRSVTDVEQVLGGVGSKISGVLPSRVYPR